MRTLWTTGSMRWGRPTHATARRVVMGIATTVALAGVAIAQPPDTNGPDSATQPERQGRGAQTGRITRPARDTDTTVAGTAVVRGLVVAADTGAPVRRAVIRLTGGNTRDARTSTTDAQGRYEIKGLGAGRYTLTASKAGFMTLEYGQRRAFEPGRPVELTDRQILDAINVALPRGAAINGRVVDEFGEPIADAVVSVSRYRFQRGQYRLSAMGFDQTNDLGQFRVYGLAPGDYIVSAVLRSNRGPFEASELEVNGYAPTYFPGVPNPSEAQRLRLTVGQEAAADFQLIPARLVKISGTVVTSDGKPAPGGMIRLADQSGIGPMAAGLQAGRIRQDGTFSLAGVAPGAYTLVATTGFGGGFGGAQGGMESARQPFSVGNEDVAGVTVTTSKGATVRGTVTIEGPQNTLTASTLRVTAVSADPDDLGGPGIGFGPGRGGAAGGTGRVGDDWSFELTNIMGRSFIGIAGVPAGWRVRGVYADGQEVTDNGFDPRAQRIDALQVVLTSRTTEVGGTVSDASGTATADFAVVIFAADEARWTHPLSRYVAEGRPGPDGTFSVKSLPPGDYLAVALDGLSSGSSGDPDILAQLRDFATSFHLADGDKKNLNLKLGAR